MIYFFSVIIASLGAYAFLLLGFLGDKEFPKPLSSKEEKEYFTKLKEGDKTARNVLIEHNLRLLAYVAKKYKNSAIDYEDLISIGTIGLCKAVDKYDIDSGTKFSTFAITCIKNEVLMVLRHDSKVPLTKSLDEPMEGDDGGKEMKLIDSIIDETVDLEIDYETKEKVEKILESFKTSLTDFESKVLKMRYGIKTGKPMTQQEIADKTGFSRSYISRLESDAVRKIKDNIS